MHRATHSKMFLELAGSAALQPKTPRRQEGLKPIVVSCAERANLKSVSRDPHLNMKSAGSAAMQPKAR
jgi:hypothetical protein